MDVELRIPILLLVQYSTDTPREEEREKLPMS